VNLTALIDFPIHKAREKGKIKAKTNNRDENLKIEKLSEN
jgi:hypothetical protein